MPALHVGTGRAARQVKPGFLFVGGEKGFFKKPFSLLMKAGNFGKFEETYKASLISSLPGSTLKRHTGIPPEKPPLGFLGRSVLEIALSCLQSGPS